MKIPRGTRLRKPALVELLVGSAAVAVLTSAPHAPTWIPVEVPHAAIGAVACPAPDSCVAVGSYHEPSGHVRGLLATLSRGAWTADLAPLPTSPPTNDAGDSDLTDIACGDRGFCVAAGWSTSAGGSPHGLLETLSGGSWTSTQAPLPARADATSAASLSAVACPSVRWCAAVGSYFDRKPSALGLIETYADGHWSATQPLAPPPNANAAPDVFLQTVNCPAADACVAIGSYVDKGGNIPELIETLAHGRWTPTEVPRAAFFAVSCPGVGSCVAVGSTYGKTGRLHGLIETLSTGTWTARLAPLPQTRATDGSPVLDAVTCPTVGSCVAIGAYVNTSLGHDDLIDVLSEHTWRPARVTLSAGNDAHHEALSCPTTASCVAVGSYLDARGTALHSLVETLSGTRWTAWPAPLPPNAEKGDPVASFDDMTCPTPVSCVAVGWYRDTAGSTQGLIETPAGPH
ncbi:MAG TPA: hypothetical protein VNC61_12535 [Acidimicrobiales bacterium]|nr:hypothetical protein [Acidimicrobiales bacterium]